MPAENMLGFHCWPMKLVFIFRGLGPLSKYWPLAVSKWSLIKSSSDPPTCGLFKHAHLMRRPWCPDNDSDVKLIIFPESGFEPRPSQCQRSYLHPFCSVISAHTSSGICGYSLIYSLCPNVCLLNSYSSARMKKLKMLNEIKINNLNVIKTCPCGSTTPK